jgi:DNA sulfur modification protein DndB
MQRDPDLKRIKNELAPYLANSEDRFFGSIIVLVYRGELSFESISVYAKGIPAGYKSSADSMGFVTLDGTTLIVLDGQHRWHALRAVKDGVVPGPAAASVPNDDVCVILIEHETNMKTRRIFNVVNRYAKQISRGDQIITSEDDGYAIVSRALLRDGEVFARRDLGPKKHEFVQWQSNTLVKRSLAFTTISALFEGVKLILGQNGVAPLDEKQRPEQADLDAYTDVVRTFWETLMTHLEPYKRAASDINAMPDLRADEAVTSLLFKPAGQIALVDGIFRAMKEGNLTLDEVVTRLNDVPDWSMTNPIWSDIIIKSGGTIDAGPEARRRMSALIAYLIAADKLEDTYKMSVWRMFNDAKQRGLVEEWRNAGFQHEMPVKDLPPPVRGVAFKTEDAQQILQKAAEAA